MWHVGMVLMASALTRWHAASRMPVSSTPWQIAGAARTLPSPYAYAATVTIPETKNAIHFNMRDARYYQIPLSSHPPAVTVNPGETVAVREIAANPARKTELVKIGVPTTNVSPESPTPLAATAMRVVAPPGGDPSVSGAYCETGWNDFLGITVGIVWNFISFSYNGSQVTGDHTWDWIRHPFPDGDYFMANRQGHMETRGTAYGWSFVIEDAPAFANTKIYWDVNEVVAHGNGRVSGYVNTWASGADKYLLGGWWQVVHG